jgi:hypothetical protein
LRHRIAALRWRIYSESKSSLQLICARKVTFRYTPCWFGVWQFHSCSLKTNDLQHVTGWRGNCRYFIGNSPLKYATSHVKLAKRS